MIKEAVKATWYRSIKIKLIIIMTTISILPILVLGAYNMEVTKRDIEERIHKEYALTTVRISHTVSDLVNTLETTLQTIALVNTDSLQTNNRAEKESLLYGILKNFPHLEEVAIIGPEGEETVKISKRYAITEEDLAGLGEARNIERLKLGKSFIGRPEKDLDNQMVFKIGVPIGGYHDKFIGGIVVKVSLRQVMKEISALEISDGSYIMLIDKSGSLIGHSDYSQVLRRQEVLKSKGVQALIRDKNEIMKHKMISHQPVVYETYTGDEVLGTYGLIPAVEWGVIVEQPLDMAYKTIKMMQRRLILVLLAIIGSIISLGGFFISQMTKPIDALARGVVAVKRGDFSYEIPRYHRDELGLVIEAFNEMTREIKKKQEHEKIVIQAEKRAAIGLLAAGVAHEINNPMNNLGFYAADLLDRLEFEDVKKLHKEGTISNYLTTIREQVERCTGITSSLLNYSRETGEVFELVNMGEIIDDTLKLIQHKISKQNIKVIANNQKTNALIWVEKSGIQQLVLNLMTNAIDAMPEGGILKIELEYDLEDKYPFIMKVSDTGSGIAKDKIPYIYDAFYTTKPIGQGTGLGLAISQVIVERMRGKIQVNSTIGKGTEFVVKLPIPIEVEYHAGN